MAHLLINTSAECIRSCAVMGGRLQGAGLPGVSWTLLPSPMFTDDQHPQRPPGSRECLPAGSLASAASECSTETDNHHHCCLAGGETEALKETVTAISPHQEPNGSLQCLRC